MHLVDLEAVDELPFSLWARWYRLEALEPFSDRRADALAFLSSLVLCRVIHRGITPTEEMFRISAPYESELRAVDTDTDGEMSRIQEADVLSRLDAGGY